MVLADGHPLAGGYLPSIYDRGDGAVPTACRGEAEKEWRRLADAMQCKWRSGVRGTVAWSMGLMGCANSWSCPQVWPHCCGSQSRAPAAKRASRARVWR